MPMLLWLIPGGFCSGFSGSGTPRRGSRAKATLSVCLRIHPNLLDSWSIIADRFVRERIRVHS